MKFAPKSEEEIDTRTLLPRGEYTATVTQATDEASKSSGRDQIHLLLRVEDSVGNRNSVHDYLLEAMAGKLRHFCAAAGLMSEYESGELTAAHCHGQDVRVKLDVEKGTGDYADKNVVRDYLPLNGQKPSGAVAPSAMRRPAGTGQISAEAAAKKAFLVVWNRFVGEFPGEAARRDFYWGQCFSEFFPGKDRTHLADADWIRFTSAVKDWDPIKGWKKKADPPFGDEQKFADDDIPF